MPEAGEKEFASMLTRHGDDWLNIDAGLQLSRKRSLKNRYLRVLRRFWPIPALAAM
jgi:hypothetical protein